MSSRSRGRATSLSPSLVLVPGGGRREEGQHAARPQAAPRPRPALAAGVDQQPRRFPLPGRRLWWPFFHCSAMPSSGSFWLGGVGRRSTRHFASLPNFPKLRITWGFLFCLKPLACFSLGSQTKIAVKRAVVWGPWKRVEALNRSTRRSNGAY
jgi:hypothetical protein